MIVQFVVTEPLKLKNNNTLDFLNLAINFIRTIPSHFTINPITIYSNRIYITLLKIEVIQIAILMDSTLGVLFNQESLT